MPLLPRREDPHDRRGHGRGSADGDRTRARRLSTGRSTAVLIWLVLAAVYVSTLGTDSVPGHDYSVDEAHYLLGAQALAEHHNLDVRPFYLRASPTAVQPSGGIIARPGPGGLRPAFDSPRLHPQGVLRKGARYEPHAIGLPLLAAPFYALGGAKAVECLIAVLLAAAMAFSYLLARRVVPDPWCAFAALAVGVSPPMVAAGTAVVPGPVAAAALAGAAVCAARLRRAPSRTAAFACFVLLGSLPWFGALFIPPAVVIAWDAIRSLRRAGRGLLAAGSAEVAFFSLALLVGLNEALFGGPTPHAADAAGVSATGANSLSDYLGRCWRIVALFLDQDYGLIRWAPVTALAFAGVWVLYRASRERLATAIAGLREEYGVARLCGWAALATVVTVALFVPSLRRGFPGRWLVPALPLMVPLVALGLRQVPRVGALLALLGLAGSIWLWVDTRSGSAFTVHRPDAPWGPLTNVFPRFHGGIWPYALLIAVLIALAVPVIREEIEVRRRFG